MPGEPPVRRPISRERLFKTPTTRESLWRETTSRKSPLQGPLPKELPLRGQPIEDINTSSNKVFEQNTQVEVLNRQREIVRLQTIIEDTKKKESYSLYRPDKDWLSM